MTVSTQSQKKAAKPLRYLITGGAGFIGSHLTELLLKQGHKVSSIDNFSTGRPENIQPFLGHPHYHFSRASITSEIVLDRMATESDIIIHLAAAVGVEKIINNPVETIETNVMGTEMVLKAALRYSCRVLVASTSEVYGKGTKIPFREEDDVLLGPTSKNRWSYAASKMVDEFLAFAYLQEFGLPTVVMRFFNTVGVRQTGQYGMVVPRFIEKAIKREPICVYGDGTQRRCFCDVRDVVKAVAGLSTHPDAVGKVVNIGSQSEISIADLAKKVKKLTGSSSPIKTISYDQAYAPGFEDMLRRVPSTARIEKLLGWAPRISLDETLISVYHYMVKESKGAKA